MKKNNIPTKQKDFALLEKEFSAIKSPFENFFKRQSSIGISLLAATVIALLWANSDYKDFYFSLNHLPLEIALGEWRLSYSLKHWVNDGLMVLFFFLLGMEIKRELLVGELKNIQQSSLVLLMAIGGMVVPALVYVGLNVNGIEGAFSGWGVPMATDAAFAIGILILLGSKVPSSAVVILSALAIVDDIGAVLVISVFYTQQIDGAALASAGGVLALLGLSNLLGLRHALIYFIGGIFLWWFIHNSGVHATTAGVLAALLVPTKSKIETGWYLRYMKKLLNRFEKIDEEDKSILEKEQQHKLNEKARELTIKAATPLQRWTESIEKPVSYSIMPIFALLNAGVVLPSDFNDIVTSSVFLGCALGLVFGKAIGISGFAWLGVKLAWVALPKDMNFTQLFGLSLLAGIGFTMSLFIASLAFSSHPSLLIEAKLGVLCGSLIAGVAGVYILLKASSQRLKAKNAE
ncbi:Na+/H+ antiporter NhaA [Aliikangiella sp. IMCC44653]